MKATSGRTPSAAKSIFIHLFCIPGIHLDVLSTLVIHLEIWWFESMHSRDPFGNPVLACEIKVSTL